MALEPRRKEIIVLDKKELMKFYKRVRNCYNCKKDYGSDYKNDRGRCPACSFMASNRVKRIMDRNSERKKQVEEPS